MSVPLLNLVDVVFQLQDRGWLRYFRSLNAKVLDLRYEIEVLNETEMCNCVRLLFSSEVDVKHVEKKHFISSEMDTTSLYHINLEASSAGTLLNYILLILDFSMMG